MKLYCQLDVLHFRINIVSYQHTDNRLNDLSVYLCLLDNMMAAVMHLFYLKWRICNIPFPTYVSHGCQNGGYIISIRLWCCFSEDYLCTILSCFNSHILCSTHIIKSKQNKKCASAYLVMVCMYCTPQSYYPVKDSWLHVLNMWSIAISLSLFKTVSYYLINGSKLNTKIKETLKFIPWSIKMYFRLDVDVSEKKRSNELFIGKIQLCSCVEFKTLFFPPLFPFQWNIWFQLRYNYWKGLLTIWTLIRYL